jgi:hypothetical protein
MANQQQIATLLKSLIAKGIDTKDAIPTIKKLLEAKIYSLDDLTDATSIPQSIHLKIRKKLVPPKKRKSTGSSTATSTKRRKLAPIEVPPVTTTPDQVLVNRSPVLTLWAAVVAKNTLQLHKKNKSNEEDTASADITWDEALSLGSAFAAHTAKQRKGNESRHLSKDGRCGARTRFGSGTHGSNDIREAVW